MNYCKCHNTISKKATRCRFCANKKENNPNYKNGRYCKINYCIDCLKLGIKTQITQRATRCYSCDRKNTYKEIEQKIYFCRTGCGKQISYSNWKYGTQHCKKCSYKYTKGNKALKKYFCIDCGKKIHSYTALYGGKRCNKCAGIKRRGKEHPNWGKISHSKGSYYKNIWMRSSWEVAFAKWCDKRHIEWLYESKTFDLGNTTYTPDFYLSNSDKFVEIKGYWRPDAIEKFQLFKKIYSNIKIRVLDVKKLKQLKILQLLINKEVK